MPPGVRASLDAADIELDDVRGRLRDAARRAGAAAHPAAPGHLGLGAQPGPAGHRRVHADRRSSATSTSTSFVEALRDASWSWLVFALVLAQIPRLPAAVSTMGSLQQPLPLGPLTALQFAICYVNLAIPSTAARVAVNVRFFQRFGVGPADGDLGRRDRLGVRVRRADRAVPGAVLPVRRSTSGCPRTPSDAQRPGDDRPDRHSSRSSCSAPSSPSSRRCAGGVVEAYREAQTALRVLRSPTQAAAAVRRQLRRPGAVRRGPRRCVEAFGEDVSLTELVLINTVVSLFAGLLPVPGGIGVSEAGLTLGLTAAGLSVGDRLRRSPSPTASPASTCRRSGAGSATAGS